LTKYTEEIRIRVSRENKDAIQAAADRASLDMSSWARMVLVAVAEHYERVSQLTTIPNSLRNTVAGIVGLDFNGKDKWLMVLAITTLPYSSEAIRTASSISRFRSIYHALALVDGNCGRVLNMVFVEIPNWSAANTIWKISELKSETL
jgi:hypothetical protein